MMEQSTVPAGVAAEAHTYLAQGGPANLGQLHAFLSDTLLFTGQGFDPPVELPSWGAFERVARDGRRARRRRPLLPGPAARGQHRLRRGALRRAGGRRGAPAPGLLRVAAPGRAALLRTLAAADAMVVTVLAAGGTKPAGASAGGEDEAWDVAELAALDVPILQGLCLTTSRAAWAGSDEGLSPLDVATQVAVPEFDGRLITVPFSFKEFDADGLTVYVPDPERAARVAGIAVRHARLRRIPNAHKRIVLMMSAYPTKHARIGNAVGLDTPASAVALLHAMAEAGYAVGELPGVAAHDGDALIHALIAAGGQDPDWLTEEQLSGNPIRIAADRYRGGSRASRGPAGARRGALGPGAGRAVRGRHGDIVLAALRAGTCADGAAAARLRREPGRDLPRPDLPPSHHYLAPTAGCAAGRGVRRRRRRAPRQARQPGVAARQDVGMSRPAAPTPRSATCR
jgi:cobaltochelatase CobN